MASRVVVGRVLLAGDQLLGVEQLPVGAGADLSKKNFTFPLRYILVLTSSTTVGSRSTKTALGTCLPAPVSEKKVLKESSPAPMAFNESLRIKIPAHLVGRHLPIGLDAVLEAVELPAGVADLATGLPDVD